MNKIINFTEAKRNINKSEISELNELYDIVKDIDIDAAFRFECGLPSGSETDAANLATLVRAFQNNPILKNQKLV